MSEYLDKIERVQAEIRKLMGGDGIGDREKTVTENQKKRRELIKGIEQHIQEVINVLDTNATYNSDGSSESGGDELPKGMKKHSHNFIIDSETIFRGFKICDDEQIDGPLKAKLYARLIREYRRNLEHIKRQA